MGGDERIDKLVDDALHSSNRVKRSVRELLDILENPPEPENESKVLAALVTIAEQYPEETLIEIASRVNNLSQGSRYRLTILISGIVEAYPEAGQHESVKDPLESLSNNHHPSIRYHAQRSLYNIDYGSERTDSRRIQMPDLSGRQIPISQTVQATKSELRDEIYNLEKEFDQEIHDQTEEIYTIKRKVEDIEGQMERIQEQVPNEQAIRDLTEEVVGERLNQALNQDIPQNAERVAATTVEDTAKQRIEELVSESVPSHYGENIYIPIFKAVTGTGVVVSIFSIIVALLLGSVPLAVVFIITTLFLIYAFQYGLGQGDTT